MRARTRGLDRQRVMDLGIWIIVSALVGAKLLLLIVDFRQFTGSPRDADRRWRDPGGVFYGGLIAAVGTAAAVHAASPLPLWTTTDVFAPGIALGHIVGRLGCLMAGLLLRPADDRCRGRSRSTIPRRRPTSGRRWASRSIRRSSTKPAPKPLILVALLLARARGRPFPGRTFWSYMLLYGVSRFVIEFYRGDNRGMVFDMLSTSQFVSVILVPLAIVMLFLLGRQLDPRRQARGAARGAA